MKKQVLLYPSPFLRKQCELCEDLDEAVSIGNKLIPLMKEFDGIGLAAPQVGVLKQVFVMYATHEEDKIAREIMTVINPDIYSEEGSMNLVEGCLSFPGLMAHVSRPHTVGVQYINGSKELVNETLTGIRAKIFHHEFDHLRGKLFIDYLNFAAQYRIKNKMKQRRRRNAKV